MISNCAYDDNCTKVGVIGSSGSPMMTEKNNGSEAHNSNTQ